MSKHLRRDVEALHRRMMSLFGVVEDMIDKAVRALCQQKVELAVEVIGQGARQGHFLTHPHTLRHLRSTQWRPGIICRRGHERWLEEGGTTLLDRAHEHMTHILAAHQPTPLPADAWAAMERIKNAER